MSDMYGDFEELEKVVVVVDDARINIAKAEYILKPKGYRVVGYDSGDRFLYDFHHEEVMPDLVLLDIEMPGKSGMETLEEFRQDILGASIPVIFVTGHVSPELIAQAAQLRVSGYIKKPFEGQDLVERVNMLLEED